MQLIMNDNDIQTTEQVRQFLEGSEPFEFEGISIEDRYRWIETVLVRFTYQRLHRADKGLIRRYVQKVSGYSRAQVCRLIRRYIKRGQIRKAECNRRRFPIRYTTRDIALLARTDGLHESLSGPATKRIMEREWVVYGHADFKKISQISIAHLYNLRNSLLYRNLNKRYLKTKPVVVRIAERARPDPGGRPGYIRVDTVHQGDSNEEKGVYHINAVDEITQWEIVASVEKISEIHLEPILESMLASFPFVIKGFHSDNGSEFVNKTVARLLNKLLIHFTKCRPRHTNDNGLVESKNGSIVRKQLGYSHIPQKYASAIDHYHREYLNVYINFHRPCYFATSIVDRKGKIKKTYPYEKLQSLSEAQSYLKPGITLQQLDEIANQMSDNDFAERMVKARSNLLQNISRNVNRDARALTSSGSFFD
jgi:transposase InsO family protein